MHAFLHCQIFTWLLLFSAFVNGAPVVSWQNPAGTLTVKLVTLEASGGQVKVLYVADEKVNDIAESNIRNENHGFWWLGDVEGRWIDERFLVFEDDMGLCIVDAQEKALLVNQRFTGFSRSPTSEDWSAIRFRPLSRQQERLDGTERDVMWLLEPYTLASRSDAASGEPFAHITKIQLNGIALSTPIWSSDGNAVAVATHNNGKVEVSLFDKRSLRLIDERTLSSLRFTPEQLLSPWFLPDVERIVQDAIVKSGILSLRSSQQPSESMDLRSSVSKDLRSGSRRAEKVAQISYDRWSLTSDTFSVLAVIAVALAAAFLVFRLRRRR